MNENKTRFAVKPVTKKKFSVSGVVELAAPPPDSTSGNLKKIVRTRPKACPCCLTENRITKTDAGRWKCKECHYEWW